MSSMIQSIKGSIVKSPLHKPALEMEARLQMMKLKTQNNIIGHKTVYCISPYKTATKYLAACYDPAVSAHEPWHYLTLREIRKSFDPFFVRRLNALNLKFECSGCFSAFIPNLLANPITSELYYVCVLRSPASWITSVINNWIKIERDRVKYVYSNELFWKELLDADLSNFINKNETEQERIVLNLSEFYFSYLENTRQLKNVVYVDIGNIDSMLPVLDEILGEKSIPPQKKVGANRNKVFRFEDTELDRKYQALIKDFTLIS